VCSHACNEYGGYLWTLPKSRVEPGDSLRGTAIKEVWEVGLHVEHCRVLLHGACSTTYSSYHLVRRVGGTQLDTRWESQVVIFAARRVIRELVKSPYGKPIVDAIESLSGSGTELLRDLPCGSA
jgi:ADP-ribose pyrophosphatase YjhB (NUDIX family)